MYKRPEEDTDGCDLMKGDGSVEGNILSDWPVSDESNNIATDGQDDDCHAEGQGF